MRVLCLRYWGPRDRVNDAGVRVRVRAVAVGSGVGNCLPACLPLHQQPSLPLSQRDAHAESRAFAALPVRRLSDWLCELSSCVMRQPCPGRPPPMRFSSWLGRGVSLTRTEVTVPLSALGRELAAAIATQLRSIATIAPIGELRQRCRRIVMSRLHSEVRHARAHSNPFLRVDTSSVLGVLDEDMSIGDDDPSFSSGVGSLGATAVAANVPRATLDEQMDELLTAARLCLDALTSALQTAGPLCAHASTLLVNLLTALSPLHPPRDAPTWTPFTDSVRPVVTMLEAAADVVERMYGLLAEALHSRWATVPASGLRFGKLWRSLHPSSHAVARASARSES